MGISVTVEGLTKSFGRQRIWQDVSLTLPAGEVSVMLGPSGTGKTVFLKSLIGLVRPERGRVMVDGVDMVHAREHALYRTRKLFGVMFQDGALFGSMTLFDNVAFPLREHTRKRESEIRRIVMERMDMVGLAGSEGKLPGEISGGMRKRAGLARALVLDPQIILCDEPDSGLDPVRTAFISQLLIDLNAQLDATMLIVTHNIDIATTLPDNIGMLFLRRLVGFGPREVLLTSAEPVIAQFLNGSRKGPIGMSEEKDADAVAAEIAAAGGRAAGVVGELPRIRPQLVPTDGLPGRQAAGRRKRRVLAMLDTLPRPAQEAILASYRDSPEAQGQAVAAPTRDGLTQILPTAAQGIGVGETEAGAGKAEAGAGESEAGTRALPTLPRRPRGTDPAPVEAPLPPTAQPPAAPSAVVPPAAPSAVVPPAVPAPPEGGERE